MWAVNPPTKTATEAVTDCAKNIGNRSLRDRVTKAIPEFTANSANLQADIHAHQLHLATRQSYPISNVTEEELKDLYKRLRRPDGKARHIYDYLMANARHGLCSYCQYAVVTALDHFVPITVIESIGIDPWNLVPSCDRCNKNMLDEFPNQPDKQPLHPYSHPFSVSEDLRWLHARIHPGPTVAVTFFAAPDDSVSPLLRSRIVNQFDRLDLAPLYAIVAARELSGTCRLLASQFPGGQPDHVTEFLGELSRDGFASDPNDRRGVMYDALSRNEWFINGGYEATGDDSV